MSVCVGVQPVAKSTMDKLSGSGKPTAKRRRVRRGMRRALFCFVTSLVVLTVLNCSWDAILNKPFLSFLKNRVLLGACACIVFLSPIVAFSSAFKPKKKKRSKGQIPPLKSSASMEEAEDQQSMMPSIPASKEG